MEENKFWACIWAMVVVGTAVVTGIISYAINENASMYIKAGYTKAYFPAAGMRWVLPDKKEAADGTR